MSAARKSVVKPSVFLPSLFAIFTLLFVTLSTVTATTRSYIRPSGSGDCSGVGIPCPDVPVDFTQTIAGLDGAPSLTVSAFQFGSLTLEGDQLFTVGPTYGTFYVGPVSSNSILTFYFANGVPADGLFGAYCVDIGLGCQVAVNSQTFNPTNSTAIGVGGPKNTLIYTFQMDPTESNGSDIFTFGAVLNPNYDTGSPNTGANALSGANLPTSYSLTQVPEPGVLSMLSVGFVGLFFALVYKGRKNVCQV